MEGWGELEVEQRVQKEIADLSREGHSWGSGVLGAEEGGKHIFYDHDEGKLNNHVCHQTAHIAR